MNHPNREELIEFLYAELGPDRQSELAGHLVACSECRARLESWRRAQRALQEWTLPSRSAPAAQSLPGAPGRRALVWAAAAAVLLLAGFAVARMVAPRPDVAALRAAIAQDVRREFQAELSRYASAQAASQAHYQDAMTKALGQLEAQRLVDYAGLRRDVETVAVHAENELLNTRQDLSRLAGLAQPPPP
jgi:anti-sigma factor RsiW